MTLSYLLVSLSHHRFKLIFMKIVTYLLYMSYQNTLLFSFKVNSYVETINSTWIIQQDGYTWFEITSLAFYVSFNKHSQLWPGETVYLVKMSKESLGLGCWDCSSNRNRLFLEVQAICLSAWKANKVTIKWNKFKWSKYSNSSYEHPLGTCFE